MGLIYPSGAGSICPNTLAWNTLLTTTCYRGIRYLGLCWVYNCPTITTQDRTASLCLTEMLINDVLLPVTPTYLGD